MAAERRLDGERRQRCRACDCAAAGARGAPRQMRMFFALELPLARHAGAHSRDAGTWADGGVLERRGARAERGPARDARNVPGGAASARGGGRDTPPACAPARRAVGAAVRRRRRRASCRRLPPGVPTVPGRVRCCDQSPHRGPWRGWPSVLDAARGARRRGTNRLGHGLKRAG